MSRLGRSVQSRVSLPLLVVVLALALLAPSAAQAADPPPLGHPTDHFASRHRIGEEGLLKLGNALTGTPLTLSRFTLQKTTPPGNPPPPQELTNPPIMTALTQKASQALTSGPTGFVQADLDQVETPNVGSRPALEPGLLIAGSGITSANGCSGGGFCLTWFRPSYDGDHKFSSFPGGGQIAVGLGPDGPESGSDIAVATGDFSDAEGTSVVVAWTHKPASGDRQVKFAHLVAQRNANGRVTALQMDGVVQTLGTVYNDSIYGVTSPAIAVGDFAGDGTDRAAVVWDAIRPATTPRVSATLLAAGTGAGMQTSVPVQTFDTPTNTGATTLNLGKQVTPGAAAQTDIRDGDDPIDRLIVSSGTAGDFNLYRLAVASTFTVETLDGPTPYKTSNSELDSLGDLDGDGIDEIAATPFYDFNDFMTAPANITGTCDLANSGTICGRAEILDFDSSFPQLGTGFTVDSAYEFPNRIETAVIDARPTEDQRIAPPPGAVDVASLPQIAISGWANAGLNTKYPMTVLMSINDTEGLITGGADIETFGLGGSASTRPPRLAPFALDGQVELGDPVQDGYRSLEPSVVLNAPPTHFDILDGEAYDPNVCYAGNQYEGNCAFESEYEKSSSTSTEVSTESSEDWAVSSTVSASADFGVAQLSAEVRAGYGENFTQVNGSSESETVTVNVKARNTDKIYAIRRAYDTLEYPLYQPGTADPEYLLASTPHTLSRRWIDSSSPDALELGVNHQPGNILSYPEDLSEQENPFISPTKGTDGVTKTTFGQDEFELSDSSDYSYALTKSKVDADSAATTKSWNVGATISGGGGLGTFVSVSAEVSGDYSQSDLSTVSTTVGDDTLLASTMGAVDESFGETAYTVKPFAYWTDSAALVLDYAVEPSTAPPGSPKTWWQQQYGARPDITLNLPRLLDFEEQAGITSDAARFISPGVKVLRGPCSSPQPLGEDAPATGDPLCLVAQVENYSLKGATTGTQVEFYDADPDLGGELLGSDSVPAIGARDHAVAFIDWTPSLKYAGTTPRIFAKVEAGDAVREIHEDNNKGFRSYEAASSATPALHPAEEVFADVGEDESSIDVEWNAPANLAPHSWLVRAYPDDGGDPIELTVDGDATSANLAVPKIGRYRVVVFAVQGGSSSAASHPAEPVDVGVASNGSTSVSFVDAPEEGGYTGPDVDISFEAGPADATTECIVDGESRPCRSPLRLRGLDGGSHTIQVSATSGGSTADTEMIAWTVDDVAPEAEMRSLPGLIRHSTVPLGYSASDEGGSGVVGYEIRARRAGPRGDFVPDPIQHDESGDLAREATLDVGAGETVCVDVRAVDGAGNEGAWTDESCTNRQVDEGRLKKRGGWEKIRGKEFSFGHALKASGAGSALLYEMDRTSKVRVLAGRCKGCGTLAIEVNGRRTKEIDLGATKREGLSIVEIDAGWPRQQDGKLKLVSLGGGPVIVDGVVVRRTST